MRYRSFHPGIKPGAPQIFAHYFGAGDISYNNEADAQRYQNDVNAAMELGLTGFAMNFFSHDQGVFISSSLTTAANAVAAANFRFFHSFDMSLGFLAADVVQTMIDTVNASTPYYLKVNGKPVLSTYGAEQAGDDTWWLNNVLTPLANQGMTVYFLPGVDIPNVNTTAPTLSAFTSLYQSWPHADGIFNFGTPEALPFRSTDAGFGTAIWSTLDGEEAHCDAAHNLGKSAMVPTMPYFFAENKPVRQSYDWQGGRGMENMWTTIINKCLSTDFVEIVTWDDWSESTYIEPARIIRNVDAGCVNFPHLGYYELMKYYIAWCKRRYRPQITRDAVFVFHRPTPKNATPTADSTYSSITWDTRQQWGQFLDVLNVTTACVSPAEIHYNTGSGSGIIVVPAGITHTDIPFQVGSQIVEIWRSGVKVTGGSVTDVLANTPSWNFNFCADYYSAGGATSSAWVPTNNWRTGFNADWFN